MQSDLDVTKSDKSVAVKHAVLDDAVAGFREVASEDRLDRPDWLASLLVDMDSQRRPPLPPKAGAFP
ncbi:hypothetical protein [Rhodococcus sp. NPDC057529]|uniref:hypothetical protein n=1 Tax=Rhodococcus sp. NPDC057529 TaxID=3346158 RepID=UPI00366FEBB9